MAKLLKRSGGIGTFLTLFVAVAWLMSPGAAQQPDPVVPAYYESENHPDSGQPPQVGEPPREISVLLLRNGEMLKGRIAKAEDGYDVFIPGGEIHVRAADVQYPCRDIDEAYFHRRSLIRGDNALDHLDMAQWCLNAGLLQPAAQELNEAAALEPSHPLLPILDRRLKVASRPVPKGDGNAKARPAGPTPQELDHMVRGMPPKTVETFAQTIQPMLVNSCSSAACHGQAVPNGFHLFRTPSGSPPSRLLTQRNLHAVLQWLDRDNPEASPLLVYPIRPHGTANVPVFTDRQVLQYRQLRDWCFRVAQADSRVMQASFHEAAPQERSFRNSSKAYRRPNRDASAGASTKEASGKTPGTLPWESARDASTIDLKDNSTSTAAARALRRDGTAPKPATDLFDPGPFNRQYGPPARPDRRTESPDRSESSSLAPSTADSQSEPPR